MRVHVVRREQVRPPNAVHARENVRPQRQARRIKRIEHETIHNRTHYDRFRAILRRRRVHKVRRRRHITAALNRVKARHRHRPSRRVAQRRRFPRHDSFSARVSAGFA